MKLGSVFMVIGVGLVHLGLSMVVLLSRIDCNFQNACLSLASRALELLLAFPLGFLVPPLQPGYMDWVVIYPALNSAVASLLYWCVAKGLISLVRKNFSR